MQQSNLNNGNSPDGSDDVGEADGVDISSQIQDVDDIEDDNGDRLINDFMCDILENENEMAILTTTAD